MFDDAGKKLKGLAWFIFIVGVIGAFIGAIIMWKNVLLAVVILLVGSLCAWITSLDVYGLGEAAE